MKTLKILETEISDTSINEVSEILINKNSIKVAICNANTLVQSVKNLSIRTTINNFDIKTPDGYPVAKARSYLTNNKFERVDGYKVFLNTVEKGLEKSVKHFFFGSSEIVTDKMCDNLRKQFPSINIAGVYNPEVLDVNEMSAKYKSYFQDIDTDIVWVSLGFPKQELFINNIKPNDKNFVGIGAVFEWVAGTKVKAPEWIADIGLEWILRLIQEPKRLFKRYLIDNTLFIYYFLKQILK
jgi:N-acetylglucosaminyldiphosphoundecaprenol N-acetyl-beta-D-mannosaminyltransferase